MHVCNFHLWITFCSTVCMNTQYLCPARIAFVILLIMLRKGSQLLKGDREVLLDLDNAGEAQTTDCYGSLQNGSFIPPRCVSTILLFSPHAALCFPISQQLNESRKWLHTHTAAISLLLCSSLHTSLTSPRCCSEPDIHWSRLWCELACITERNKNVLRWNMTLWHYMIMLWSFPSHLSGLIIAKWRLLWCCVMAQDFMV